MNDRNDSDSQRLNAFVDRELDDAEQEAMLSAIERDPRKRIELSDLYHLKEMVRTAYSDDKGYTTGRSLDRLGISGSIAASILLLAAVFAGGYQAGNWSSSPSSNGRHT